MKGTGEAAQKAAGERMAGTREEIRRQPLSTGTAADVTVANEKIGGTA